ncbi:MAG TPA: hypothetical protein VKB19_01035 [Pedobacter sp.]|nr:hypothetical protein [Pedobacter sp.]
MGFIKNALIGVALYEAAKYIWKTKRLEYSTADVHADDSTGLVTDTHFNTYKRKDDLEIGTDPEASLGGHMEEKVPNDPWKGTLADDELRAPDA